MKHHLLTIGLAALIGAVSIWAHQLDKARGRQGAQAHEALCVLKHDFVQRVKDGQDFLAKNPNGIPGIPPSLIRNSIENQEKTVEALNASGLTCN